MAKQTDIRMAFKDFEEQAKESIGLTVDYCEEELRQIRVHHSLPNPPRYQALTSAALSVQQSIKTFLAISRIANK